MESPFSGGPFRPEEAYAKSAERFFELLKGFSVPGAPPGTARDWAGLVNPLAAQFEQWLRLSQSAGPWFQAAQPGSAPGGLGAAPPWTFGPLPLGPAAVPDANAQRLWELLTRLTQVQGALGAHWSEIARTAAQRFIARAGGSPAALSFEQSVKLYELWVSCAEEAYAATARSEEFARLQSELANVSAALLVEQRRHAEALVRAFGLPTRAEVDALYDQLKDLRERLPASTPRARPRAERPAGARDKRGARRKPAGKPRGRRA
jgi:hypothetical protein